MSRQCEWGGTDFGDGNATEWIGHPGRQAAADLAELAAVD